MNRNFQINDLVIDLISAFLYEKDTDYRKFPNTGQKMKNIQEIIHFLLQIENNEVWAAKSDTFTWKLDF